VDSDRRLRDDDAHMNRLRAPSAVQGYTLIELLIVVAIIGLRTPFPAQLWRQRAPS
jgi:prepilin-type N-terminal cleavage/methylation domain-containing protein